MLRYTVSKTSKYMILVSKITHANRIVSLFILVSIMLSIHTTLA